MIVALALSLMLGQANYTGNTGNMRNFQGSPQPVDYCTGFRAGYKSGWCYRDQALCPQPVPPVCPPPQPGKTSLEDGYSRGLFAGREARARLPTYQPNVQKPQPTGQRPWTSFFN